MKKRATGVASERDNERGREKRDEERDGREKAEMADARDIDPIFRRMPARRRSYRLTGASLDYDLS